MFDSFYLQLQVPQQQPVFSTIFDDARSMGPLVHCITNYVTVNDVANAILAIGASPIMADDAAEVEEITSLCSALYVNIGTLNKRTIESMLIASRKAHQLGKQMVLDPVGAGASTLRTDTARRLLDEGGFSLVRGNMSEIKAIAGAGGNTKGVDANIADTVTEESLDEALAFAKGFAAAHGCTVAITGAIDLVADAEHCYVIRGGRREMGTITGTGCQLSGITAAFLCASENTVEAAAAAVCAMGLAGETAWGLMQPGEGNSTYRNRIIDVLYNMTGEELVAGARYDVR